jgi:hypothetical protein
LAAYGLQADPLRGEWKTFQSHKWKAGLILRALVAGAVVGLISRSGLLAVWMTVSVGIQPIIRFSVHEHRTAETEIAGVALVLVPVYLFIYHFHISPVNVPEILAINSQHLSAFCIVVSALVFSVRGGTYIVRGLLRKAGTLPKKTDAATRITDVDQVEFNRGRLIGNLERITLALVIAAGSYAALGFLIAAKGLVRFEEFTEGGRDFTEYFLIGSLASALIALFVGLTVRYVLLALWPELLAMHMGP